MARGQKHYDSCQGYSPRARRTTPWAEQPKIPRAGWSSATKGGAARGRTSASHDTTTLRFQRSYMARRASTCLFCVADGISDRSVGIIPIPGPSRPPRCGPPLVVGDGPSRPATWHAVVMPSVVEGLRPAILSGFLGISNLPGNFACFPRLSAEAGHALCRPRGITAVYPPPSPLHFSLD